MDATAKYVGSSTRSEHVPITKFSGLLSLKLIQHIKYNCGTIKTPLPARGLASLCGKDSREQNSLYEMLGVGHHFVFHVSWILSVYSVSVTSSHQVVFYCSKSSTCLLYTSDAADE